MKILLAATLLLSLLLPMRSHALILKVLSFNISGLLIHRHNPERFNIIAKELLNRRLAGNEPDIVLLQEAFFSNVKPVLKNAGYKYIYRGPKDNFFKGKFVSSGLYILSNYPLTDTNKVILSKYCRGWDCFANKSAIHGRIKIEGFPVELDILTTHLQANADQPADKTSKIRSKQFKKIGAFLEKHTSNDRPMIFAGDFNTRPFDPKRPEYPELPEILNALNAGEFCLSSFDCVIDTSTKHEDLWVDSKDQHFFRSSKNVEITPVYAARTFQEVYSGETVSDHFGYEIWYDLKIQ